MKATLSIALFVTLTGSFLLPQSLWARSVFENPSPGSFQSGVGVISGWVCEAERIDIVFNPGTATEETWRAGYRTTREDTAYTKEGAVICGDTDNGFGLLFNWNRLGDGQHTVSALADGVEFGRATFTVTTLGKEFLEEELLEDVRREFVVEDFPVDGSDITLAWQQSLQNFVIQGDMRSSGGTSGTPPRILENPQPGSFQSGVGVISGWVCEADWIDIVFNPGTATEETWRAGYRTTREDTAYTKEGAVICGDTDNGFGLLFNWNRLGDGQHTVSALADGVEFGRATVTVTTFGEEFPKNLGKHARLEDFPEDGTDLIVAWQQSLQNFTIARLDNLAPRIASIDAIGDSVSKAVNARECTNEDQEHFNWATSITQDDAFCSDGGDGVYSQAERIECRQGAMIVNADPNSAESGAEMLKDFFAQAQESAALFGMEPPAAPRYVTVEMGHNDICSGTIERIQADCEEGDDQDPMNHCRTTEAAFEREFRKGLDVLVAVPELKIGIAAPVRVSQLCNHAAKRNCSLLGGSCGSLWENVVTLGILSTGICGSITIDCSEERLKDGYETARAYRDIMERVSSEYAALAEGETSPEVTVGGETVGGAVRAAGASLRFSNASWVYKFKSDQLSCCDCFHPSVRGQDGAARILFDGFTCGPADVCCADTGNPVSDALCRAEDTSGTFHPGLF